MARDVMPLSELRALLVSIRDRAELLKGRAIHHSLIDWIKRVLADIERAEAQSISDAASGLLGDYEAELNRLLDQSQRCKCKANDCPNRSEAAA